MEQGINVKGMFRIQITEEGEVVGDSGWQENNVMDLGFNKYLCSLLGSSAAASYVSYMALGTSGEPATNATAIAGELEVRTAVTYESSSTSKTARFLATFGSSDNFVTKTESISNVGLFMSSAKAAGTLFAGNSYASSTCATNQDVNATYDIIFT